MEERRTGKTTAALTVAVGLAAQGKRVSYIIAHTTMLDYVTHLACQIAEQLGLKNFKYLHATREMEFEGVGRTLKFVMVDDAERALRGDRPKVFVDHSVRPNRRTADFLRIIDTP